MAYERGGGKQAVGLKKVGLQDVDLRKKGDQTATATATDALFDITRPAERVCLDDAQGQCDSYSGAEIADGAVESAENGADGASAEDSGGFWHELLAELMYLEATSAYWALQAANPADMGYQQLQLHLHSSQVRSVGESACEEYLTCLNCSRHYYVRGTITVSPCDCGCEYFSVGQHH